MTTAKTEAAAKGKKLNVQVPGETTTAKTEAAADAKPDATLADVGLAAETPKAQRNYRDMHAKDIDPTTLTAPVLSKDGWVCPSK